MMMGSKIAAAGGMPLRPLRLGRDRLKAGRSRARRVSVEAVGVVSIAEGRLGSAVVQRRDGEVVLVGYGRARVAAEG